MKYLVLCNLLIVFFCQVENVNTQGELVVTISNLKNNNGQIGIRIFNQPKGFPTERSEVYKEIFVIPKNNKAQVTLSLNKGTYAIVCIHDENKNKELDRNFIGKPVEGLGVSNNPKIRFRPPSFNEAKFDFEESGKKIVININYL